MGVKRVIILLVLIRIAAISTYGQGALPYFCMEEGATLEYVRRTTDGDIKWYHTMRICNIESSEDGAEVEYTSHILNRRGKGYYGEAPAELSALISEGNVTLNVGESVAAVFRTIFPRNDRISSMGGLSTLPSDMVPGDTLPEAHASVKLLGLTMNIDVTQRGVLRFETIRTPAGEYECVVIRESKVEKGMGRNRHTIADTWYARGVGMIRHDTYNKDMELQTSEVLVSLNCL